MVTKIMTGIKVTSVNYQKFARSIWVTCFGLGLLLAFFGQDAPAGIALIYCSVIGLPAFFIDQGNKQKGGE